MSGPEGEFPSNRLFRTTRGIGGASHKIYPQSSAVTPHAILHHVTLKSIAIRDVNPGRQSWKSQFILCRLFGLTDSHTLSIMPEKREVLTSNP